MAREVQTADPDLRRRVLAILVLAGLLGVLGVLRLEAYLAELQALARSSPHEAAAHALEVSRLVLAAAAVLVAVLAAYLGRLSWRTLRAGRYPPPGTRVLSDTRVVRGPRARRYGWIFLALAIAILATGVLVAYQADRRLRSLLAPGLAPTDVSPAELGRE